MVLRHACRLSLEGVVSKGNAKPVGAEQGLIKSKCAKRQSSDCRVRVINHLTKAIGSLVLGVYDDGELRMSAGSARASA